MLYTYNKLIRDKNVKIMEDKGFTKIEIIKDLAGIDRVICGQKRMD